jgi:hypothetical protein
MISQWDGSQWSTAAAPDNGGESSFNAISGTSVNGVADAWMLGPPTAAVHRDSAGMFTGYTLPDYVESIWEVAPDNVWAVSWSAQGGYVSHWTNSWVMSTIPNVTYLISVWASGPNDVWSVGQDNVVHWSGDTGSAVVRNIPQVSNLRGVFGFGGGDVWAVGQNSQGAAGEVVFWPAGWSSSSQVVPVDGVTRLLAIWGSDSKNIWAVGDVADGTGHTTGAIVHWSNGPMSTPDISTIDATTELRSIWGSGPNDIWVVGCSGCTPPGTASVVLHYTGTWSAKMYPKNLIVANGVWGVAR